MCGRIALKVRDPGGMDEFAHAPRDLENYFGLDIRPSQQVLALSANGLEPHPWGIHHTIQGKPKFTINAKQEKFGGRFWGRAAQSKDHRCAVPVSAWYEWTGANGAKTRWRFTWSNSEVFWLAGLLSTRGAPESMVIATRTAPGELAEYHHRAPCALTYEGAWEWIEEGALPFAETGYSVSEFDGAALRQD